MSKLLKLVYVEKSKKTGCNIHNVIFWFQNILEVIPTGQCVQGSAALASDAGVLFCATLVKLNVPRNGGANCISGSLRRRVSFAKVCQCQN